jgi:hypothetical protein
MARDSDPYNAAAFVCLGNCSLRRADYNKARDFFLCALDNDAACVEALYNLGTKSCVQFILPFLFSSSLKNRYYYLLLKKYIYVYIRFDVPIDPPT